MRIWQSGIYRVGPVRFYNAAHPQRSCLGLSLDRGIPVETIKLTGADLQMGDLRLDIIGLYVEQLGTPSLEILAPEGRKL